MNAAGTALSPPTGCGTEDNISEIAPRDILLKFLKNEERQKKGAL
jgi:hypothetical protein